MKLSEDEKIILSKYKRAKRYAQDDKQAALEICILPGGKTCLVKAVFQEKLKTDELELDK